MPRSATWTSDAFEVRPSNIEGAGLGLFARVAIALEDTLGYYTGEVITEKELYHPDRPVSSYVLWVCSNHVIIGEGPLANYTRFINHSPEPNAFLIVSTRWKTARFEALRPIAPGEEILFNYGDGYW